MSTKDLQEKVAEIMKRWQKIEDSSVESTGDIIAKTNHPLVKMVMEIIQQDSKMHKRIQEFIVDTLEKKPVTITPDEMGDVWTMIEDHITLEKHTMELAAMAQDALKGKKMVVQEYLINYLMVDEDKHNKILDDLNTIKKGMYPYG
jgi:hypothetical protein